MKQILAAIMTFLVVVPVTAFAQPDWMVKARETEDMIFGRINVDCSHVYNSDVNLCFLQTAFSNATQLSISYMQEWISERYYNKTESDNRFASIIWNYNQTTPAINYINNQISYVTNWITSSYWNTTQIIDRYFNKTESDSRYVLFNQDAVKTMLVYTVGNSSSSSTSVMTEMTNMTWNTSSNRYIGFNCYINYVSNSTTNGMGLMIDVVPSPTKIDYIASFPRGTGDSADTLFVGYGTSVNDTIESPASHQENVPLLINVYGNIEGSNRIVQMYFRSEALGKKDTIINGSNCRWWGFG